MVYVIGSLMAGLSFLLNKLLLKYIGIKVVISYSPVVEEVSKSLCAYYLGANILITHVIFGILEGIYDWVHRENGERGAIAALLSVVGHSFFGTVTMLSLHLADNILLAIVIASCIHVIWNVALIRFTD